MVIVKLSGGLGNQMFQYACGKAIALKLKTDLRLDHSFFYHNFKKSGATPRKYELGAFGINLKIDESDFLKVRISKKLNRLFNINLFYNHVKERNSYLADTKFPLNENLYITGYFQSEKYFSTESAQIKKDFSFIEPNKKNLELINRVVNTPNSVGILVRRDDFISSKLDQSLGLDYFENAIKVIKDRICDPFFFVFTIGDTGWSRNLLKFDDNIEIVENDSLEIKGFEKMRLMSLCKHNIIANSSFGWWSAWLNTNPNKVVIYPEKWHFDENINIEILKDRFPQNWIKV